MGLVVEIQRFEKIYPQLVNPETLHVFNGQEMMQVVQENNLLSKSLKASFNEAMCTRATSYPIFDEAFQELRAKGHQSTSDQYQEIVIEHLRPLFEKSFAAIVLWFGEDVFCQLNLLTLLAFLEQEKLKIPVHVVTFDEPTYEKMTLHSVILAGFQATYCRVLIEKSPANTCHFPILDEAIESYLALQQKDNRLTRFIQANQALEIEALVSELMTNFPQYGYGDIQYEELIQEVKNNAKDN